MKKGYTLRKISRKECERRGLNVYKLSGTSMLIATYAQLKEYKARDSSTWGHLFEGGKIFGVCIKKYKRYEDAYIICPKPEFIMLRVKKFKPCPYTGVTTKEVYREVNNNSTFKHYSVNGIIRSNKSIYNHVVGGFFV